MILSRIGIHVTHYELTMHGAIKCVPMCCQCACFVSFWSSMGLVHPLAALPPPPPPPPPRCHDTIIGTVDTPQTTGIGLPVNL